MKHLKTVTAQPPAMAIGLPGLLLVKDIFRKHNAIT